MAPLLLLAALALASASASAASTSSSSSALGAPDALDALLASADAACDARFGRRNATTHRCDCRAGFSGWGCRMCDASGASGASATCASALGAGFECVEGLAFDAAAASKTYACTLSPDLQALFADGALAVHCERAARNCSAAVFKAQQGVDSEHVIDCALSGCDFADGSASGACELIRCRCGSQCSELTKTIVETQLSGKPARISVSSATDLSIDIEGSPIPLSATCNASACEYKGGGSGSSGSGSGSGSSGGGGGVSGLVIALITVAAVAGVLLLCGLACACLVSTRIEKDQGPDDVDDQLLALTSRSGTELQFRHINCYADSPDQQSGAATASSKPGAPSQRKRILHNISGSVRRGQVLGLLGPSGSGKTSLLNALAAVENGKSSFSGEVRLDGRKISKGYRKIAAYVQQDDSLFSTLTVRECISYSAQLRLPSTMSERAKHAMVERVINELNLGHVANSRIGSSGRSRGVSGGERRRVSIGMELVTAPQILILDEPTSGLDSSSAHSVVQLVKELANHGRMVILSIHQPSAKSFHLLDRIMLLGKGKLLYSGAPGESKSYFNDLGFRCPEHENIADFILDIAADTKNIPMIRSHMKGNTTPPPSSPSSSSFNISTTAMRLETFTPKFSIGSPQSESSPFMKEDIALDTPQLEHMLGPGTPKEMGVMASPPTPSISDASGSPTARSESEASESHLMARQQQRSASRNQLVNAPKRSKWIEIRVLFWRTSQNILRHRSLLVLHVVLSLALALCGGLIFNHVTNDLAGFQNRSGAFYFILTFFGFASMSSMDLFIAERTIFLRETGAMYYGAFPYFLAKATLDSLLLRVLPATLFASIFYWIMGLQNKPSCFFMFVLTLILFNVAAGAICVLVGVLSRRVGPANLAATVVFLIMLLFGGFLLNSQTMPAYVGWVKHFSIYSYAFEILMTNELKGLLLKFDAPGYPPVPVYGEVFLKTLGMDYSNRYYDLTALALIAAGLNVLAFLFLALQVPLHNDMAIDDDSQQGRRESADEVEASSSTEKSEDVV